MLTLIVEKEKEKRRLLQVRSPQKRAVTHKLTKCSTVSSVLAWWRILWCVTIARKSLVRCAWKSGWPSRKESVRSVEHLWGHINWSDAALLKISCNRCTKWNRAKKSRKSLTRSSVRSTRRRWSIFAIRVRCLFVVIVLFSAQNTKVTTLSIWRKSISDMWIRLRPKMDLYKSD